MQLVTMIGAVALLSTSAMVMCDKMEKKNLDHWWQLRDSQPGRRHNHKQAQRDSSPSSTDGAAASITVVDAVVMSDGAVITGGEAYTTDYITLQSGDTSDFVSAYTTMYFDLTASESASSPESSHSHHKHHHHTHTRKQQISLTSICSATTRYITITTSVTVSTFVSSSQSYNSSISKQTSSERSLSLGTNNTSAAVTYTGAASSAPPSSVSVFSGMVTSAPASSTTAPARSTSSILASSTPASSAPASSSPASSTATNSGAFASGTTSSSEAVGSSTSTPSQRHHTRRRTTRARDHHHTPSPSSSSVTTTVWISASAVSVASGTSAMHPSSTVTPTTTIGSSVPTGTPNKNATHCGVHGLPNGDYFIAEYIENSKDVHVTLLGCYEFCLGAYGATRGCVAYEFYADLDLGPEETRCKLYGASVADSLWSFSSVPNVWYDLDCGNPMISH